MKLRSWIVAVVALMIPLLAAVVPMRGQSGDLRLSYDPWQPVLPAEILIQSGVQSGEWSLVVFGTTERVGDSVLPVLVMQLLKDTALSGPQQKLTSEEARPFGYVQVVSVGERFLVFWKDRRGGDTSIWMRTVDTSGKLGPEEEYRGWPFPAQGAMVLEVGGRTRLLWNDTSAQGGILWQGVDSLGYPSAGLSFMDSGRASGIMGPFGNGVRAVLRVNELPILLDSVGEKVAEGSWSRKFSEKWHLSRDGVVTTVQGDTALVLYANVLDTVAERVIRFVLPKPDEGSISPNSVCPYRDEDDSLFVIYGVGGGSASGVYNSVPICFVRAMINSIGQGVLVGGQPPSCQNQSPSSPGYINVSISTSRQVMWDGYCRIIIMPTSTSRYSTQCGNATYSIDYVATINSLSSQLSHGDSSLIQQSINKCLRIPHTINKAITSHAFDNNHFLRNIEFVFPNTKIRLTANAVLQRRNTIEEEPALSINNNKIIVGWINRSLDTTAEIVRWERNTDTSIASQSLLTKELMVDRAMMQGTNRFMAAVTHQWTESTPQGDSIRRRCELYFPTDTGWNVSAGADSAGAIKGLQLFTWNQNPENEEFVIQFGNIAAGTYYLEKVIAIEKNGSQAWRISNPPTSGGFPRIIPASDRRVFISINMIGKDNLLYQTDDSTIYFQRVPSINGHAAKRLLGSYFIRWNGYEDIEIFKFNNDGIVTLQYKTKFKQDTLSINDVNIIQNPSDSGFAMIYTTSNNGVWMKTLSRTLQQLTPLAKIGGSTALTTTPRAVFKGDSLFVVWIDHRNGVADVYGTVVVPQTALSVSKEVVAGGRGLRILPNPVVRQARVELAGSASTDRVLVVQDVAGRQLRRFVVRAGVSEEVIDLQGIAAGTYLISVVGEGRGELLIVGE